MPVCHATLVLQGVGQCHTCRDTCQGHEPRVAVCPLTILSLDATEGLTAGTPQPAAHSGHRGHPDSWQLTPGAGCAGAGGSVSPSPGCLGPAVPRGPPCAYLRRCWQGPSRRVPTETPSWQDRAMSPGPAAFIATGCHVAGSQGRLRSPVCQLQAVVMGQTWHLPCHMQLLEPKGSLGCWGHGCNELCLFSPQPLDCKRGEHHRALLKGRGAACRHTVGWQWGCTYWNRCQYLACGRSPLSPCLSQICWLQRCFSMWP